MGPIERAAHRQMKLFVLLVLGSCISIAAFTTKPTVQKLSWKPLPRTRPSHKVRHYTTTSPKDHRTIFQPTLFAENDPKESISKPTTAAETDELFDGGMTFTLVGGQSVLIIVALVAAVLAKTPNYGFGTNFVLNLDSFGRGALYTLPLFGIAKLLDLVEDSVPLLKDVTKATQRSVIALLGGTRKPVLALFVSGALGLAAGLGEELLFRGVLQYELLSRFGTEIAVVVTSLIFGALHLVTPIYGLLAFLASLFFGSLYNNTQNLAIPIVCHALYDVGALLWAHYEVTALTNEEREEILNWEGPDEE
mmetsp:Transcript_57882/g.69644  ORF Transcript_57882/g.69644 Transcript_57882/m.69644 type:complete len:307 (-) Transcript_57882:188-1108(-)